MRYFHSPPITNTCLARKAESFHKKTFNEICPRNKLETHFISLRSQFELIMTVSRRSRHSETIRHSKSLRHCSLLKTNYCGNLINDDSPEVGQLSRSFYVVKEKCETFLNSLSLLLDSRRDMEASLFACGLL